MTISVICPTYNRPERHKNLYAIFNAQDYKEKELLVFDDSPEASPFFSDLQDSRVRYTHLPSISSIATFSIGVKRNCLVDSAQGDIVSHFDDDDYYGPTYLSTMKQLLADSDFVKLSNWLTWRESDKTLWECDMESIDETNFVVEGEGEVARFDAFVQLTKEQVASLHHEFAWGYSFSYVYRKALWKEHPFLDKNHGEDYLFVKECQQAGCAMSLRADKAHLVLHTLHPKSTSRIFPRRKLEVSYALELFGEAIVPWIA